MGHLWLIGMMGSGKSTLGRRLAAETGTRFVDVDDEVTRRLGCTIAELWGDRGEAAFRDLEAAAVEQLADESDAVIATGGGVVLRSRNVEAMRTSGTVVWLTAAVPTLAMRVGDGGGRPLLAGTTPETALAHIAADREPRYAEAAHHVIDTGGDLDSALERLRETWNAGS